MTKTGSCSKREEKMATKIGRSVVAVKTQLLEWVVDPTPGIARAKTDWKVEVWELTKRTAVMSYHESETALLKKVYEQLRPCILVYGRPDPIILAEVAPLFLVEKANGTLTIKDFEKWQSRKLF